MNPRVTPIDSAVVVFRCRFVWRVAGTSLCQIIEFLFLPLPRVAELGEAEAGHGFACAGEELLHQPLFVLPQGFELPALRRDQVVQRAEAVGDLLLLGDASG